VTYQFIHGGMFWFFISMLVLWIMARPLEEEWGSPRFLAFWLVSTLGAAGAALLLNRPLASDVFLSASLLFTFATKYPETTFYVFFVLPVKVKWLGIIGGGFLVLSSFAYGIAGGVVNVVGMSAGYVFFLLTRRLPSRRQLSFKLKSRKAEMARRSEDDAAARRNTVWDPRVREAAERARARGEVAEGDLPLLEELDAARDPSVTVCAPEDFGFTDDPVCRSCPGYAECAARRIRHSAEAGRADDRAGQEETDR
jgi:hypothetical protein